VVTSLRLAGEGGAKGGGVRRACADDPVRGSKHQRVLVASEPVKLRHQGKAGPYLPFANAYLFVRTVWLYAVYATPWGETRVAGALRASWR
jgi:hypothetical protein